MNLGCDDAIDLPRRAQPCPAQLETAGAGAIDTSVSTMEGGSFLGGSGMGVKKGETPDVKKFTARLQETYKERINFYRESVYLLTG